MFKRGIISIDLLIFNLFPGIEQFAETEKSGALDIRESTMSFRVEIMAKKILLLKIKLSLSC